MRSRRLRSAIDGEEVVKARRKGNGGARYWDNRDVRERREREPHPSHSHYVWATHSTAAYEPGCRAVGM